MTSPEALDDSSSFTDSAFTVASSSTVWGPGTLAGKVLKIVGEKSLDLVVSVVIRRRLALIKQMLENNPWVLRNPQGAREWQQMNEAYTDLKESCRECYPSSIRRAAANLVRDIALITRPGPEIDASPTHTQWEALLARLQRPGGILSMPPETVISVDKFPNVTMSTHEDPFPSDSGRGIQVGVTVEVSQSYEVLDGHPNRKAPLFFQVPRMFKFGRQMRAGPDAPHRIKPAYTDAHLQRVEVGTTTSWFSFRSRQASKTVRQLALSIRDKMCQPTHGSSPTQLTPFTARKDSENVGSHLLGHSSPSMSTSRFHKNDTRDLPRAMENPKPSLRTGAARKKYPGRTLKSAGAAVVSSSLSPALPEVALSLALPSPAPKSRTIFNIRRELERARKVVHELESDLLVASIEGLSESGTGGVIRDGNNTMTAFSTHLDVASGTEPLDQREIYGRKGNPR